MSTPSDLEAAKSASTAQLLFKASRLWNEAAVARMAAQGIPVRESHTRLFPHIDFVGRRAVDIAADAGISKQAVSRTLKELDSLGVIERIADPQDRRAQLVRFTDHGRLAMMHGLSVLRDMEAELAQGLGRAEMEQLHARLAQLLALLDAR